MVTNEYKVKNISPLNFLLPNILYFINYLTYARQFIRHV